MKRTLSLLLVAAMLLATPVLPATPASAVATTAQKENITPLTDACPCGCGKNLKDVDWQPLPSGIRGSIPEGHHYLTEDIVQGNYGLTIIAGTKVVVDLRGFTWTNSYTDTRILTVQGDMWLMDTVGGGKLAPKIKKVYGGAILVDAYEVAHPTFTLCSGTITSGAGSALPEGAGVIYAWEDSGFIMTGGVVENIHAGKYGGAIMAGGTASIEILGGTIRNCSAGIRGGAVYSASSTPVVVKNTTFIGNTVADNTTATNGGGAIYSVPKLTVENCTFMDNSTTANGGAVYASGGLNIKNSTFIGNSANNGGDISISGSAESVIDGCKFYGGYSTLNGGAIYASGAKLTVKNTEMMGAIADKQGGHIYQSGGTVTIEDSTLNGGISNWEGSVYCGGGNLFALSSAVTTITDSVIRNGFAKVYGGNIALAATTLTLNNSTVTGGVAKYHGNNIGAQSASTVTINGGTIDGDIYIPAGKPIVLKGKLTIGLRNNGLATGENANIDASGLTAGSEVYISGTGNVVAAGANAGYFKGAVRTTLAGGGDAAITGTVSTTGYCPHCLQEVTWSAYNGELTSGHYYMADSIEANTNYSYKDGVDVVIDLNGKTITDTSSRAFTTSITGGATKLSILDSAGNGLVQSYGPGVDYKGGVIFTNGELNIYGGTFANKGGTYASDGGVLWNNGEGDTTIYGGFFDGNAFTNTTENAGLGGVIGCSSNTNLTIHAGHFVGSQGVSTGGILYVSSEADVTISGGTFVNGVAANSGNFYFYDGTYNEIRVENAVIRGGTATTSAGNIHPGKGAINTFKNCYIADGKTTDSGGYGGNISVGGTNASFVDCIIYGGESAKGGNVYTAGTLGALTLDGCLITGGSAINNGGNIMFNHGNHQILGGEISYGASRIGGNIYSHAGNHASGGSVTFKKNSDNEVPLIFGGRAVLMTESQTAAYGGNISVVGVMDLTDAIIYGGEAATLGQDIQLAKGNVATRLTVGSGVTGGATGTIKMTTAVPNAVYGETVPYTVCNNELNANIVLEGDYGQPSILAKDGVLKVAGVQSMYADGSTAWYADYSDAAAVGSEGIIKLYADAELNLTGDSYVDLNGKTATVSGNGKLLGMDTTGDDYSLPTGKVTFSGTSPVADKSIVYAPNGNKYVALVDGGAVTYHRLGADLTSASFSTERNTIYFKGVFAADDALKALIDTYGIAVSLKEMPNEQLAYSLKSTYSGGEMENGNTVRGMYVKNILKEGLTDAQNDERGRDKIYAVAYVKLTDGTTTYISDQSSTEEDDVAWSLYDVFNRLDELIDEDPTIYRRYTNSMREYYAKWKDQGIQDWIREDTNFVAPEKDDVIDVLMIGSSSCYYYVEEMASLACAAGIKLRVCNVYYSGCPIDKYYRDWLDNYADYQFFDTTAEWVDGEIVATRKALGGGKTLEWCLAQGEWDVISMQSRGALVMRDYLKGVDHLEASDIKEASEFMLPYVKSQFPDSHFYLREQSAYQVGKVLTVGGGLSAYKFEDLADQQLYAYAQKDASDRMVAKFNAAPYNLNMRLMPASQAMMLVREGFGQWEGYDQLCARIGFTPTSPDVSHRENDPHEGDHGHVGDIGGGQYVEGALWLQSIMQNHYDPDFDVRDITWEPTYTYKGEVVPNRFNAEFLREAAYKAATEGWSYTPAA